MNSSIILFVVLMLLIVTISYGQSENVTIILDKDSYLVGEPIGIKIITGKVAGIANCSILKNVTVLYDFSIMTNVPYTLNVELEEGNYRIVVNYYNYTTYTIFRVVKNESASKAPVTVNLEIEQSTYRTGESIFVKGFVDPFLVNESINLAIVKNGTVESLLNVVTQDGSFEYSIPADFEENGTYCIVVEYMNVSNSTCLNYYKLKKEVYLDVELDKDPYSIGEEVDVKVKLFSKNNPLDGSVLVYLNDVYFTSVDVKEGNGNFTFVVNETEVVLRVLFHGNETYESKEYEEVIKVLVPLIDVYHSIPEHEEVTIGVPVTWHKTIILSNKGGGITNYTVDLDLPKDAFNVSISVLNGG